MRCESWDGVKRILAVRLDNLGDIVMTGPALRTLRERFAGASLTLLASFSGTDLEGQWQPRRAPATLLRRPTPCEPSCRLECPYNMECLDISPSTVATACEEMIERTVARQ